MGTDGFLQAVGVCDGVDVLERDTADSRVAGNHVVQRFLLRFVLLERDGNAARKDAGTVLVDNGSRGAALASVVQLGAFLPVDKPLARENLLEVFEDGEVAASFVLGRGGQIDESVMGQENRVRLDCAPGVVAGTWL